MATPFQIFVNGELPKRPFTQDAAVSWTPGRVLVTTGVALGVTTEVFPAPPVTSVNSSTGAVVITADSLSAIPTSQKGAASGVASLDASGFVPMSQMNPGVVERLYVVTDETARFALTTSQVQNGDVVKQELPAPAAMYYVQDDTNLDSELGYAVFAVGTAAAVAWSGVTGIPQVLLDLENISGAVTGDILQFDGLNWIKQSRDTYVTGLDLQTSDIEGLDTALGEKQVHDVTLDALSNLPDLGFIVQIAEDSFTSRSLEAGDGITITYPDGVDGNPLIAFAEGPSEAAGTHGDENTYLGLDIDSHGRTTLVTQLRLRKDTVYIPNSTDSLTLEAKTLYMIGDYVTNTYGELNLQLPILTTEALIEIQVAFTVQSISQVNLTPNGVDLIFGQSASVDINTVLPPLLPGCVLRLFYHSVGLGWVASVLYSDNVSSLHVHQTNSTSFTNKHVITSDATEYRTLSIPDANLSLGDVITQLTFDRDTDVLTGLRSDTTEVTTLFNQGYLDELFNPDGVSLSTPLKVGRTYRSSGTIQVHPVETPVYLPAATADAFNSHESMPIKIIMRDDVLDSGYLHLTPQFGDDLMYATVSGVVSSGGNEVPIPNHSVVTCYMVQAGTWYVEVKQDSTYLDTDHFSVVDPLDRTKSVKLNVAPVSTDTQRVITIPDSDVSLGKIPTGTAPVFSSGKLMVPLADGTSIPLSTFGGTHLTGPNSPATNLASNGHYLFYKDTVSYYSGIMELALPTTPADLSYVRISNIGSPSSFEAGAGATITPGGSDKINGTAAALDLTDYLVNYRSAVITFTYSSSSANWTVSVLGDLIKPGTVAIYDADKTNTTTLTPVTDLTTNRVITLPDANVDLGKVLSSISYAPTTGVITITNVDATTIATTNTGVIADDMLRIQATGAATKKMGFNCSAVTAGQTRIVTMPDTNVDLGKVLSSISYAPTTGVITLTNVDASTFATTNIGAIADDMLRIQATGAATKKMGFDCSQVTAGQTRFITMPDANVDLGQTVKGSFTPKELLASSGSQNLEANYSYYLPASYAGALNLAMPTSAAIGTTFDIGSIYSTGLDGTSGVNLTALNLTIPAGEYITGWGGAGLGATINLLVSYVTTIDGYRTPNFTQGCTFRLTKTGATSWAIKPTFGSALPQRFIVKNEGGTGGTVVSTTVPTNTYRELTLPNVSIDLGNVTTSTTESGAFVYATGMGSVVKTITSLGTSFNIDQLANHKEHSVTIRSNADNLPPFDTTTAFSFVTTRLGGASIGFYDESGVGLLGTCTTALPLGVTLAPNESWEVRYIGASGLVDYFSVKRSFNQWIAIPGDTNATLASGFSYIATNTSGSKVYTLPATPSVGKVIRLKCNNFVAFNQTLARNGSTINGTASNITLNLNGTYTFLYNSLNTWEVSFEESDYLAANSVSGTRNRVIGGVSNTVSGTDNVIVGCSSSDFYGTQVTALGTFGIYSFGQTPFPRQAIILGTSSSPRQVIFGDEPPYAAAFGGITCCWTNLRSANGVLQYALLDGSNTPSSTSCPSLLTSSGAICSATHEVEFIISTGDTSISPFAPKRTYFAKRKVYVERHSAGVATVVLVTLEADQQLGDATSGSITCTVGTDQANNRLLPSVTVTYSTNQSVWQASVRITSHHNRK